MKKIFSLFVLLTLVLVPFMVQAAGPAGGTVGAYSLNNTRPTYGYSEIAKTPANAATDVVVLYGSATKTIKVKKITVEQASATAANILSVSLVKRTTLNTDGTTAATATITKFDSTQTGSTATPILYSANATVGTGTVISTNALVFSLTNPNRIVWDYTNGNGSPITLRGVSQGLAINFNSQTKPSGGTINVNFEFEEF